MEKTFDAQSVSIQIPNGGPATVTDKATWTHPGQAQYEIQKVEALFTPGQDWYRLAVRDSTGQTNIIDTQSQSGQYSGTEQSVEIPSTAWQTAGGDTYNLVFFKSSFATTYSGIRLRVTYQARASESTVTVAAATAGSPQAVTMTNSASGVKHKVTWTYPGGISSGETSVPAGTGTASWSVPAASLPDLYAAVTDRDRATGTVTVTTLLEDGTVVGTSAYPAELTFPDSIGPTGTATQTLTLDATGQAIHDADTSWTVIAGHTDFTLAVSAAAQYGATVEGILLTTTDGDISIPTGGSGTVHILTGGSWAWALTVTDSRGIHRTSTGSLTVQTVQEPAVTALEAIRWEGSSASGHASDEGTRVRIRVTVSAGTPASAAEVTYTIRQVGAGTVIETGTVSGDTYAGSGLLQKDRAYTVTVTVEDSFGRTAASETEIPSAVYTIHRMAGGQGIAFGKTADKFGAEISPDWPMYTHGEEILRLILDSAHPPGSCLLTIDGDEDPNTRWKWTDWARLGDVSIGGISAHAWIRTR